MIAQCTLTGGYGATLFLTLRTLQLVWRKVRPCKTKTPTCASAFNEDWTAQYFWMVGEKVFRLGLLVWSMDCRGWLIGCLLTEYHHYTHRPHHPSRPRHHLLAHLLCCLSLLGHVISFIIALFMIHSRSFHFPLSQAVGTLLSWRAANTCFINWFTAIISLPSQQPTIHEMDWWELQGKYALFFSLIKTEMRAWIVDMKEVLAS